MILMLIKYLSLKKTHTVNITHPNTLLGIMITGLLDHLFISQTTGYVNKFDKNKITMSLMIKDMQLFKKYNKIWKKS